MRKTIIAAAAAAIAITATAASAQDMTTSFRGFRIEGNAGGDRFQSGGDHNDKFGYGGTVGFDGMIGDKIVIGPEASYWRANNWNGNCVGGVIGGTVCTKSFQEYGAAIRAGYQITPALMVFGKGGYVNNEQRRAFTAPAGEQSFYDHYRADGYQVGGGVEFSLDQLHTPVPLYTNVQYVYSRYDDHTARQRVMAGIGLRFK